MALGFGHKHDTTQATPATASISVQTSEAPVSGKVSLSKNQGISLLKKPQPTPIVASNGWENPKKDFDLKALVRYRDSRLIYVGAANRDEVLNTPEGAVMHGGDVTSGSSERETITIHWHPDIASVALSSYSALENKQGSFNEYGVFVEATYGNLTVGIPAENANASRTSYTCLFAEVIFNTDGSFTLVGREDYSESGKEERIGYRGDKVMMDIGPVGQPKD